MLSLRYHRQYLWVFFFMFMALSVTALFLDCYYVANSSAGGSSGTGSFQLRTPRFINVFSVFLFAAVSAVLQNSISRSIIKPEVLAGDRKFWYIKNVKVKCRKAKVKKLAKKKKYFSFMLASILCNVINLVPLLVLYGLWVGKVAGVENLMGISTWKSMTSRTTLAPEFFVPALFVKYLSWYLNGFLSSMGLFRRNPRRNILLATPLNI